MSKLESELKAVRDRAAALTSGQRLKLGTRQSLAGLSNVTRGSLGLGTVGVRKSVAGASAAARGAGSAAWSGAKKLSSQARSTEAQLAADARKLGAEYLDTAHLDTALDVFPIHITNPTLVSGLERTGLADSLPSQLATTRSPSRRRVKIALVSVGVLAAGAAALAISLRTRPQPPSVAAAPPRLADVPVAGEETKPLDHAAPSPNGQADS